MESVKLFFFTMADNNSALWSVITQSDRTRYRIQHSIDQIQNLHKSHIAFMNDQWLYSWWVEGRASTKICFQPLEQRKHSNDFIKPYG